MLNNPFTFKIIQPLPQIDAGYLKIPRCDSCFTYISKRDRIIKQKWECHICLRCQKLSDWYMEMQIQHDSYQLITNNPKFIYRALCMIDVTNPILCQMITPLIMESLHRFDEIAIVILTPFPTVFEFNRKLKVVTLTNDCEYKISQIFLNCIQDYGKIKQIIRIISTLAEHHKNLVQNENAVQMALQFLKRFQEYKSIKIIHFIWIKHFSGLQVEEITNFTHHYQLYIIDETKSIRNEFDDISKMLNGNNQIYDLDQLDQFYEDVSDYLVNRLFGWNGQVKIKGLQELDGNIVEKDIIEMANLDDKREVQIKVKDRDKCQIQVGYFEQNRKITLIYNL